MHSFNVALFNTSTFQYCVLYCCTNNIPLLINSQCLTCFSDTIFSAAQSNAEFFIVNFYVLYIEIPLFCVALIKDSFLFFPPTEFHYQLVPSVTIW